jgi:hypothetical protein
MSLFLPNKARSLDGGISLLPHSEGLWPAASAERRYASSMATIVPLFFLLLLCEPVSAARLTYSGCREAVEQQCATNTIPQDERIFVRVMPTKEAIIVRFHKGTSLREIIDQTSFRGKTAWVSVLRPDHPILDYRNRVGRKEKPKDDVKPLDLIVINDNGEIINT